MSGSILVSYPHEDNEQQVSPKKLEVVSPSRGSFAPSTKPHQNHNRKYSEKRRTGKTKFPRTLSLSLSFLITISERFLSFFFFLIRRTRNSTNYQRREKKQQLSSPRETDLSHSRETRSMLKYTRFSESPAEIKEKVRKHRNHVHSFGNERSL